MKTHARSILLVVVALLTLGSPLSVLASPILGSALMQRGDPGLWTQRLDSLKPPAAALAAKPFEDTQPPKVQTGAATQAVPPPSPSPAARRMAGAEPPALSQTTEGSSLLDRFQAWITGVARSMQQ